MNARFENGKLVIQSQGQRFEISNSKNEALQVLEKLRNEIENCHRLVELYEIVGKEISDSEKVEELLQKVQNWDLPPSEKSTPLEKEYRIPPPCEPSFEDSNKIFISVQISPSKHVKLALIDSTFFPAFDESPIYEHFLLHWNSSEIRATGLKPAFDLEEKMVEILPPLAERKEYYKTYAFSVDGEYYTDIVFDVPRQKSWYPHFMGIREPSTGKVIPTDDFESYGLFQYYP